MKRYATFKPQWYGLGRLKAGGRVDARELLEFGALLQGSGSWPVSAGGVSWSLQQKNWKRRR